MPNPFINPPPADPTTQTLAILTNTCVGAFSQLLAALQNAQNWIFFNPLGLTPQQVATALGANGADLFGLAQAPIPRLLVCPQKNGRWEEPTVLVGPGPIKSYLQPSAVSGQPSAPKADR